MFAHDLAPILTGALAGIVDIGTSWLSDVKEGVCKDAFWLNKEQCCWSANDTTLEYDRCKQVSCQCAVWQMIQLYSMTDVNRLVVSVLFGK